MAQSKSKKKSPPSSSQSGPKSRKGTGQAPRPQGTLFIIGGREDKLNDRVILRTLAERIGDGKLVVTTVASEHHEELWEEYEQVFRHLGIKHIAHLTITHREEPADNKHLELLQDVQAVFFTGGDQLKITTKLGGTPLIERIEQIFRNGGIVAGTSAGASVMSATMLVGHNDKSHKIGAALLLAPGLGFVKDIIIDQHFSERGRIGRLLGAVAQNPRMLGVGIDENTAIIVEAGKYFRVLGSGAVYVLDGHDQTYTNMSEAASDQILSVFNLRLHVLSQDDRFNLLHREPIPALTEEA
jgi:cyanophycinase